jgi:uncharacterized protein (TIGR02996 family)
MPDEDGFLAAIRQTPADDTARLVYADWLDEQDDGASKLKAAFIRLELQMAEAPEKSLNRVRWTNKLQKLAAQIDSTWLAVISHPKLEACRMSFRFECPKQWEQLTPTDVPKVRFCESCQQPVHFCNSLPEARDHATRGNCVALTLALVRKPDDLLTAPIGQPIRLAPHQIERLGRPTHLDATVGAPMYELPLPAPVPRWVPETQPEDRTERPNRRRSRKNSRRRNRNIQREDREESE